EAVGQLRKEVRGVVVYDPLVASTSNVASAVAGIEQLIAVRYDPRPTSLYSRLCLSGPRLPVKRWLVNPDGSPLFSGQGLIPGTQRPSSGSVKCDPYLWFIEHYMKTGRCPADYAGYYPDQFWRTKPARVNPNHHQLTNHDFFVARRGFFFDLSPWGDEPATDDTLQPSGTDYRTLCELLSTADSLGRGRRMCYIGGFPAWAFKYTKRVGGHHEDVATEWQFSELISHYNAFKDADAIGFGALANASFWQHFPTQRRYPQPRVTLDDLRRRGFLDSQGRVDTSRNYFVIYTGDYDASSWVSQMMPLLWESPVRGTLPMMWCVSPVLGQRVPHVLHYLRRTASPADYFAAADNGAGYMMPGTAEWQDSVEGSGRHIATWARHCRRHYRKWGLRATGFIIDGNGPAMKQRALDAYAKFSPEGIVPQKCPLASLHRGMPVLRSDWDLVSSNPREAAQVLVDRLAERPLPFHWFRCILKSPEWHSQVVAEAQRLEPSLTLLDAPTFFLLLRCWLEEQTTENVAR
ncbi:MAG: hypothetical protein K5945_09670, partial [Bacteroidaceae bacterium]|nr:hypothetical protein [Bacteroidaceae bacterium]